MGEDEIKYDWQPISNIYRIIEAATVLFAEVLGLLELTELESGLSIRSGLKKAYRSCWKEITGMEVPE